MTALDKLIEAVEAGEAGPVVAEAAFPASNTPSIRIFGIYLQGWQWIIRAHEGSLDAALALHSALLPGRTLSVGQNAHYGDWNAWVRYAEDGEILDEYTAGSDTAGRSLLLAILRAYRSVQS